MLTLYIQHGVRLTIEMSQENFPMHLTRFSHCAARDGFLSPAAASCFCGTPLTTPDFPAYAPAAFTYQESLTGT